MSDGVDHHVHAVRRPDTPIGPGLLTTPRPPLRPQLNRLGGPLQLAQQLHVPEQVEVTGVAAVVAVQGDVRAEAGGL